LQDKCGKILRRAFEKYGADNLSFSILEEGIPKNRIIEREIYWIAKYDTFHNGYNATAGGDTYEKLSIDEMEVIREKISKSKFGDNNPVRKNPELVKGKNNGMYGKIPHNAEKFRYKMSLLGKYMNSCLIGSVRIF
jgi:group I intron endonuclease